MIFFCRRTSISVAAPAMAAVLRAASDTREISGNSPCKSGARKSDVMGPIAEKLERDDMLAIALYFSQKAWPNLRQARALDAIATRATRTNTSVGCTGCHQAGYQGEGTQPRLAGQSADYILKSMMDFRTRARGNNPGMSDLMNATSEDDLKALAAYLAGL